MRAFTSVWIAIPVLLVGCSADQVRTRGGARADAGVPTVSVPQPNEDGTCGRIELGANPGLQPRVMIVLDKSQSMATAGLWDQAVEAVRGITQQLEDRIEFGLATFPDYVPSLGEGLITPIDQAAACGAGSIKVDMALGSAAAIENELRNATVAGNTPTAATLQAVRFGIVAADAPSQVVVLVTDGAPNCNVNPPPGARCTSSDPDPQCIDRHRLDSTAVDEVRSLAAAGLRVYVVGFRTSQYADILDAMAEAGGTARSTHILADNGADLREALTGIASSVLPCTYELDAVPADLSYVKVVLDDVPLDHESVSPSRGWRLQGDRTVELVGDACATVQDATRPHEISITVECEPVTLF